MFQTSMLLFVLVKHKSKDFFQLQFSDEYDRFPPHIDSGIQYKNSKMYLIQWPLPIFFKTENTFYVREQRYCEEKSERTLPK